MRIAIIGAGIAGAVLAHELGQDATNKVTVFDKSRGTGGRMATRYQDDIEFDHGAQFFTARTTAFQIFLKEHCKATTAEWQPKVVTLAGQAKPYSRLWFEPHYVATPRMSSLCKALLEDTEVLKQTQVMQIHSEQRQHLLEDAHGEQYGPFDWVVSTAPAEQSLSIMPDATELNQVRFSPCFALMMPWREATPNWHAAKVNHSNLEWLCFNQTKPGRTHAPSLLAHSSADYATENFERPIEAVKAELTGELANTLNVPLATPEVSIHRWRYARVLAPLGQPYWIDTKTQRAACGDWCLGDNIEDAFTSASHLAKQLASLTKPTHRI